MKAAEFPGKHAPALSAVAPWLALGSVGVAVVLVAIFTLANVISPNILAGEGIPITLTSKALLTADDLRSVKGARIAIDSYSNVQETTLQDYIKENPKGASRAVHPSTCSSKFEGSLAWAVADKSTYAGWDSDVIYEVDDIDTDSAGQSAFREQLVRHFATAAAATRFVAAERASYRDCPIATYADSNDAQNDVTYHFNPVTLNLGLDSLVEQGVLQGQNVPPDALNVYLRNQNVVYELLLSSGSEPQHGIDPATLAVVKAAAAKLTALD
jgi:hypothetical protein